ncbi:MAG: Glycerol-3-phosphate acyltransferase [Verrucomicrobia subdivision 3 bacterium]|nr:Glycerol-3-phosphate acyltransferase [Limisphaerales bacterium]MCS1414332.1 Glycerol-3-phosphate acyltransferase [Limisphaerales bacterium]
MDSVISILVGYFLGSIPFGFLMGKLKGIDLRQEGSGNIGATNVLRILGKPSGITVLVFDVLKGAMACWLAPMVVEVILGTAAFDFQIVAITAGFSAVLGHNYTCWLRFKGGKGIATSAGVLLVLTPAGLAISVATFLLLLALTRIVSVGSLGAAVILPLGTWITGGRGALLGIATLMGLLAVYKHRVNIRRLLAGTEPQIKQKKEEES